ncbi:MAG: hypothetical protein V3T99_06990 [Nitrososphaerales archaeon]
MVDVLTVLVIILRLMVIILGATVVLIAIRAYRRTRESFMFLVAVGLVLITIGSFVEGLFFEFTGRTNPAHALESTLAVIGFLIIIYAIRSS